MKLVDQFSEPVSSSNSTADNSAIKLTMQAFHAMYVLNKHLVKAVKATAQELNASAS